MQTLSIIFGVFCAAMIGSSVQALTCYESNQDGDLVEVTNDDFTFCVLMPERIEGNKFIEGKAFGIGPNSDSTGMYDKVFSLNTNLYQVLTLCLYERYNFDKISSKFTFKQPEFLLRCFCNTDRCNSEKTFTSYIDNLRIDSSVHRAKGLGRSA